MRGEAKRPAEPGGAAIRRFTLRGGGDFDLHIDPDVSIGYLSRIDSVVRLYLQETLTFLLLTIEAAVAFAPPAKG